MLAGSLLGSTTVHTDPLRIMSFASTNEGESKLKVGIIKREEEQKQSDQTRPTEQINQPERDVPPGHRNDAISVGAIEQDHFPLKLHKLLEQLEKDGKNHIIGWNPDGKSFSVFRPKEFAAEIMAKHFRRQSRYKSFQRQLNLYAFKRECHGHIKGVYSHELFVRSNRDLCKGMKRERASSGKGDRASIGGTTTMRGRSSNQSEASSSQSPDHSSRKRPLQTMAQHERDMLLASQDPVTLAMKQKMYRMTDPVSGLTEVPDKVKGDIYRSHSEPTFMMSALDCDNRNVSSNDKEASSIALMPNFELREGYNSTSASSIVAAYTQDDMNLTYQAQSSTSQLFKMAAGIHETVASSDVAFRALSDCNNLVQREVAILDGFSTNRVYPFPDLASSVPSAHTGILPTNPNVSSSHLSRGMNVTDGNPMGLPNNSNYRPDEDDSGSIGTIDDFDNMMG